MRPPITLDAKKAVTEPSHDHVVTVCSKCLQASCWHGIFMCDEAREAGTTTKTVAELRKLNLEHPCYWTED